jgi:predicted ATP-dependent endonuclease of OLD family
MILKIVRVRKFKSINDSESVPIESQVTCLVGKNESGKTAFLEALYRLNPVPTGHRETFEELHDYPRRRRGLERDAIPSTVPVEAVFELEDEDVKEIESSFGKGAIESREVTVNKSYQNIRTLSVSINEKATIDFLLTKNGLESQLSNGCSNLKELRDKLSKGDTALPAGHSFLSVISNLDIHAQVQQILERKLPRFLFFDQYSVMPGRFSISRIQSDDKNLTAHERTAFSLLKLANVESSEFTKTDYEARKAALESASVQITDEVFEFWSQNKELRVDFDVDFKSGNENCYPSPFLDVRIYNDRHKMSLNFSERSTGFVWFFSFLAFFSQYRNKNEKLILLLDEPGLSLHASAQADLLRFIDERLVQRHQIIYTTHSPFMIQPTELQRVRTVEDIIETGTRVSTDVLTTNKDTIFPLQAALGYELAQTLFVGPNNLVVEGPSDIIYFQILSNHLNSLKREGLDSRWTIVPAGGVDKIPTFIALLGSQLNIAVVLDVATGGSQKIDSMVERGILSADRLFPLPDFAGGKEADVEDLFDNQFYLELLKDSGEADVKMSDLKKGGRIIKRLESTLARELNHYKPAFYLLTHQANLLPRISPQTLDSFEKLFHKVNIGITSFKKM